MYAKGMNPAERVLKMIKNLEKITFRKWKKWWNQKLDFLQTSSVFTVDRPPM